MQKFRFGRYEVEGGIGTVTIDRPSVLNALGYAHHLELAEVWDQFLADPDTHVAILTGTGDRAFCAGYDLRDASTEPGRYYWQLDGPEGFGGLTQRRMPDKPILAAVNGHAIGGGFALAVSCHLVIASSTATFGMPEPKLGLSSAFGGLERVTQQIGMKHAMEILLTGERFTAAEGYRMGFVNRVLPAEEVMPAARRLAAQIASIPAAATRANLQAAEGASRLPLEIAVRHVYPATAALWSTPAFKRGIRVNDFVNEERSE